VEVDVSLTSLPHIRHIINDSEMFFDNTIFVISFENINLFSIIVYKKNNALINY